MVVGKDETRLVLTVGRRCRRGRRDEDSVRHGGAWARGSARRGRWRAT